jgi:hypothetical protein
MILDRERVAAALPAYEIGGELGRGGWGAVVDGRHRQLGRPVAIKQLPRAFAASADVRARFLAEAQLLASLDHPHIVPVYDFVETDGLCLLVMEKLTQGTVWSRFLADGFTADQACAVAVAACTALDHAHRHDILHRDVKPENLMFSSGQVLKVTDFGIAKMVGGQQHLVTRAGEVLGTPAYMAPEQAQAKELGPATDVYATGVMLYELVSGQLPFPDDGDAVGLLYRHVHEDPPDVAELVPGLPSSVATTLMQALARDPGDRFPTAEVFAVALAQAATEAWGQGWVGRSGLPVMAAGAIAAATERPSAELVADRAAPAAPTSASSVVPPAPRPAPATEAEPDVPMIPVRPSTPMRPRVTLHTRGELTDDTTTADVVPVQEVVRRPAIPWVELLGVLGLVLGALVVAGIGVGTPSRGGDVGPGSVAITQAASEAPPAVELFDQATDVTTQGRIELDLERPVQVVGVAGTDLAGVELQLSPLGLVVGRAGAAGEPELGPDGTTRATVDLAGSRHVVGGPATAELVLSDGTRRTFGIEVTRSPVLTAPGVTAVALLLFLAAYAESLLRSLRRGRKRITATAGLVAIGLILVPLAATGGAWALAWAEPTVVTVVVGAVLGGLAGGVLARAGSKLSQRRRPRARRV